MSRPVRKLPIPVYRAIRSLVAIVEEATGVGTREIMSRSKAAPTARARQIVCWAARRQGISAERIAAGLDRHHTTVEHGCQVAERLRAADAAFRRMTDRVLDQSRGRDLRAAA